MIAIISSDSRECTALAALCHGRNWNVTVCAAVRAFRILLDGSKPRVVLTRQKVVDGYSDDVLAALKAAGAHDTRVIVITNAGIGAAHEARQLTLGADCVLRDPVSADVLMAYVGKFWNRQTSRAPSARATRATPLRFAGAVLDPVDRRLERGGRTAKLSPREVALARLLIESAGTVVRYDELYNEILGRRFEGETLNMRVLLGKLCASARLVGISLRPWIQVIPKLGYRYSAAAPSENRGVTPPAAAPVRRQKQ